MTQKDGPTPTHASLTQTIIGLVDTSAIIRKHLEQIEDDFRAMIQRLKTAALEKDQEALMLRTFEVALTESGNNVKAVEELVEQLTCCTAEMRTACDTDIVQAN